MSTFYISILDTNRWRHIHVCRHVHAQTLPLFHFAHHRLSLSPGFSASPIPLSPSLLFSLLHFLSHRGSGGPPPQSIMVKSQSTAAHSGHCADKLVREERGRRGGETGGCTGGRLGDRGRVRWVHCTVKEWARSPPGRVGNGWVSQYHW